MSDHTSNHSSNEHDEGKCVAGYIKPWKIWNCFMYWH